MTATHEVLNQAPPLPDLDLYRGDAVLHAGVVREGADWAAGRLETFGSLAGSTETFQWAEDANRFPPELRTHDRHGHRVDQVDYHPAWHRLMERAVAHGLHSLPWEEPRPGAHVARTALFYLASQAEAGHACPVSMTYAVLPSQRQQPELAAHWEPKILSRTYDPSFRPADQKAGVLTGMALTEKQGGSDVRANTSRAVPLDGGGPGGRYRLTGHKWFCSAPMCDAFLVLAQAPSGLSCFLLPRWTPEGEVNPFHLQRLKDKLGNRSNASSEVEFEDAHAWMVGEEGAGVKVIVEMINHTRLDCATGSAALMRQALVQAIHHTDHREAFGRVLAEQPAMANVLADLALEWEAATQLVLRLVGSFDRAGDEYEDHFRRLATPVVKYWVCKRTAGVVGEALECFGGSGYVEESLMPRLFRESPLNGIWEGSSNVIALDALRAIRRVPAALDAVLEEVRLGGERRSVERAEEVARFAAVGDLSEGGARRAVEMLATALAASLLSRHAPPPVADAFSRSRLGREGGADYGTLPGDIDHPAIVARARPAA